MKLAEMTLRSGTYLGLLDNDEKTFKFEKDFENKTVPLHKIGTGILLNKTVLACTIKTEDKLLLKCIIKEDF
jgi:hypothetical protein